MIFSSNTTITLQLRTYTKDYSQIDVDRKNAGFLLAYRTYVSQSSTDDEHRESSPDGSISGMESPGESINSKKSVNIHIKWSALGAKVIQTEINAFVWNKVLMQEIDYFPFQNIGEQKSKMEDIALLFTNILKGNSHLSIWGAFCTNNRFLPFM